MPQKINNKYDLIYIVGYMASGKTTFGKQLATALKFDFVDLDKLIEQKEKENIETIFASKKEAYFRKKETAVLNETKDLKKTVISCGGGTPCFNNNMQFINENGLSIWLKVPLAFIIHRLNNSNSKRPLLQAYSNDALLEFVNNQMQERTIFYQQAQIVYEFDKIQKKDFIQLVKNEIEFLN